MTDAQVEMQIASNRQYARLLYAYETRGEELRKARERSELVTLGDRMTARVAIATAMLQAIRIYNTEGKVPAKQFAHDKARSLVDDFMPVQIPDTPNAKSEGLT